MIQTLFGPQESKPGLFERMKNAVASTRSTLVEHVDELVRGKKEIDPALLDQLEEILIAGDVGVATTQQVLESVRQAADRGQLKDASNLKAEVQKELLNILQKTSDGAAKQAEPPIVILVVGVNGTGKTTTIGKLAFQLGQDGKKVLLCAGDTFRAAAVEQLEIWGQRTSSEVIKQRDGADPSAVLFDALSAARSRQYDFVLVDTAGRLHTKTNLMAELEKMRRTSERVIPGAPHEVLLVMDATTGQNGLQQARQFTDVVKVTGIVLTKLDGTAKGGVVLAIANELKLPIRYVGVGEQKQDLLPFVPEQFIASLFA